MAEKMDPPVDSAGPDGLHPFERKGLGFAPFEFVGLRREPGGCAYCGRSLSWSCDVKDVRGRVIVVGTDCVGRTNAPGRLRSEVEQALILAKRAAAAEKKEADRRQWWRFRTLVGNTMRREPLLFEDQTSKRHERLTRRYDAEQTLRRGKMTECRALFAACEAAVPATTAEMAGAYDAGYEVGYALPRDSTTKSHEAVPKGLAVWVDSCWMAGFNAGLSDKWRDTRPPPKER